MDDKLIKMEHFFMADMKIKQEMNLLCPPNEYLGEDDVIRYLDNAFDSFQYVFSELKCMAVDFSLPKLVEKIQKLEQDTYSKFMQCGTNISQLKKAYETLVSDMSIEFLNAVKSECVGYTNGSNIIDSINRANTMNEILHLLHSHVINNEEILQAIPAIAQKENNQKSPIILRGNSSAYFNQLFQYFPLDLDCGIVDMVTINATKMIMMVRDRGHALTIEITLNNDVARIEYFVPKLCNISMINRLPGIHPVKEGSVGAIGVFEVEKGQMFYNIWNLISKVPTDDDMEFQR